MKARAPRCDDRGMGMIEIVVSLLLLAILTAAILPVFVNSQNRATQNVLLAQANQAVNNELDIAEAQATATATCASVDTVAVTAPVDVPNPSGAILSYTRTVGSCPTVYPGTVKVTATVTQKSTGIQLATATTLVAVNAAS